jgi:hypothetical protein
MSFTDLDAVEKKFGMGVTEMSPAELVSYLKISMWEVCNIDLRIDGAGVRERAVFTYLQKVYGKEAGRIIKWVLCHHEGKTEKGKPVSFFSFEKARKWWTDELYAEMQAEMRKPVVDKAEIENRFQKASGFFRSQA